MDDLISRQAAIDDLHTKDPSMIWDAADVEVWVNALPSAQPKNDGFCTDCKEYDSERHFCPRFDRVIKKTIEEMGIIRCGNCKHWKNDHLCEVLSRFGTFETEVYFYCGFAERREE